MQQITIYGVLALLLLGVSGVHAQWTVGLTGGLNRAHIIYNTTQANFIEFEDTSLRLGWIAGFFVGRKGPGLLRYRMGLQYQGQGDVNTFAVDGSKTAYRLHYLAAPLLMGVALGPVVVEAGPQLGYLLKAEFEGANADEPMDSKLDEPRWDWGATLGARLVHRRWELGLHYYLGGQNLWRGVTFTDSNGEPLADRPSVQNRALQLRLGYQLLRTAG